MKAVILAGGFGTRLSRVSEGKPKPLVEVAGKSILEHQIALLIAHGIDDIRLSLHHKADAIIAFCQNRWPGRVEFVVEPTPLGTGGGIKYATRDIQGTFLVINGDTLSDVDFGVLAKQTPHTITCVWRDDARDFGLVHITDGAVAAFSEKPKSLIPGYINAGVYVLNQDAFAHIAGDSFMMETDVFPYLAEQQALRAFIHQGYWTDVGTEQRLEEARVYHNHAITRNT